jgi:hypothetical protein
MVYIAEHGGKCPAMNKKYFNDENEVMPPSSQINGIFKYGDLCGVL